MNYELYHHGVKGQKWGVRRQKKYDYQDSEGYISARGWDRTSQRLTYDRTKRLVGKKRANRIEYNVRERGKSRALQTTKEMAKRTLATAAVAGVSYVAVTKGAKWLNNNRSYLLAYNGVASAYRNMNGDYSKQFVISPTALKQGKQFIEQYARSM